MKRPASAPIRVVAALSLLSVDATGITNSKTFGKITSAGAPRNWQLAIRYAL